MKTQGDRGFSFTGSKYDNQFPNYIRKTEDLGEFKNLLKHIYSDYLLIKQSKYTINSKSYSCLTLFVHYKAL